MAYGSNILKNCLTARNANASFIFFINGVYFWHNDCILFVNYSYNGSCLSQRSNMFKICFTAHNESSFVYKGVNI